MTFEEFKASRVTMTKTQYAKTYGTPIDNEDLKKVEVYADGMHIEDNLDGSYTVIYDRSEVTDRLAICEQALWDNFAKYELNPKSIIDNASIREAIQNANEAFWCEVSQAFPTITSGDFPPDATAAFDKAQIDAVRLWIEINDR